MESFTEVREHEFELLTSQKVHVLFDEDGEPVVIGDPDEPVHQVVGCIVCNAVADSGFTTNECPGSADWDEV